ncbi:hypothetical protein BH09BAC2_BH09BAC2_00280 [soil metagenome]
MQAAQLKKAAVLAIIIVAVSMSFWEIYLRNLSFEPTFDDGPALWSDKRAMVYEPGEKTTVFIGSSRNKYDIDIATWKSITGEDAIQLSVEGNSPLPVLDDLADDKNFKGKLIIDVTERLFFSTLGNNIDAPQEHVAYYKKQTPAQRFSFFVNNILENEFVFLDKEFLSLNAMLSKLPVPKRKGKTYEPFDYPAEASRIKFNRQNYMMDSFIADTVSQNHVKAIWEFYEKRNKELPASGNKLDSFFTAIKASCDKIKARGGKVLFLRTPSSGYYWDIETRNFPREKYWNQLLAYTNCPGIHFKDYYSTASLICPETSHLGYEQAIYFTKSFIQILDEKKFFALPYKQIALNNINIKTYKHGF